MGKQHPPVVGLSTTDEWQEAATYGEALRDLLELAAPGRYTKSFRGWNAVAEAEGIDRREVHYEGLVQGVGFRYTAVRIAARFGVTGYVQNLPDGRVLMVAEGPSEELDRFLAAVRSAMGRYIEDVDETVRPVTGEFRDFGVRY